jgi:voltage-gated potassium channel
MYQQIKQRVNEILTSGSQERSSRFVMLFLSILIVLNVLAVILSTVASLQTQFKTAFAVFETVSVIIFSIEYVLRVWSCTADIRYTGAITGRIKYILSPMALVDLLAILPFYIPFIISVDLRFIRVLRLFRFIRLLKIGRYSEALDLIERVVKSKLEELILSLLIMSIVLILSSSLMYFVEYPAQPEKFASIPQAMWWGITTLTTVGYGDVYPITTAGKVLGGLITMLGIALFALPAGILSSAFAGEFRKRQAEPKACPHCGKNI